MGTNATSLPTLTTPIQAIIALVNKQANQETPVLSTEEQQFVDRLAGRLPNRKLKGKWVRTEAEVIALPVEEVDVARGLFLSELGSDPDALKKTEAYEATLDLMALQILAKLPSQATPEQKIRAMNDYIFFDMGYRFPPHSMYAKDIDLYTFLPSVIDSRRGVCLGVSILYICLAQRLNLQLEMITPPGHIYVRYRKGNQEINIETTARGIHIDSEEYLGIETRSLEQHTAKEVIGLAHMNQAAVYWQREQPEAALASYQKALPYLPGYMHLKELMAYNYLLAGQTDQGVALLKEVKDYLPDHAITKNTIAEDYLSGNADIEDLSAVFVHVDETRESLLKKRDRLLKAVEKHPQFRSGLFSLAGTWLQLHRLGESLEVLEKLHQIDNGDPSVEYYLSALYAERLDENRSWEHLLRAEEIVEARGHHPKALKELRRELLKGHL